MTEREQARNANRTEGDRVDREAPVSVNGSTVVSSSRSASVQAGEIGVAR